MSLDEAHSYAYLVLYEDFNISQKEGRAKVKELRAHGYYSEIVVEIYGVEVQRSFARTM